MNVRLHIDRLVIDGLDLPRAQSGAVVAAVERELAQLIASGAIAWSSSAVPSVRAPQIDVARDAKPAQLGGAIANAVYGSLGGKR
jgi:hypothetical protein